MSTEDKCHEAVFYPRTQTGGPCDKQAVAMRRDPEEGQPYPVCYRHARSASLMVPLPDLLAEAERRGAVKALDRLADEAESTVEWAWLHDRINAIENGADL